MYLHIGNNVMLPEKHIIGVFDLEITSQSKRTSEFLRRAEDESLVIDACEDIPKSFLVCDHPYHPQLVYLSELSSQTAGWSPIGMGVRSQRGDSLSKENPPFGTPREMRGESPSTPDIAGLQLE